VPEIFLSFSGCSFYLQLVYFVRLIVLIFVGPQTFVDVYENIWSRFPLSLFLKYQNIFINLSKWKGDNNNKFDVVR